jgi:hypothetical protein
MALGALVCVVGVVVSSAQAGEKRGRRDSGGGVLRCDRGTVARRRARTAVVRLIGTLTFLQTDPG